MIRLLLADDEPVIIRGLKKLLPWQSFGLEIIGEVNNGLELIKAVEEKSVDIIISDICMPGLSGVDVIRKIRELNLNTKVIFISGFQEFSYAKEAMKHGAIDYLVKPVDKNELEKVILQTISLIKKERTDITNQDKLNQLEKKNSLETSRNYLDSLIEGELINQGNLDIKQNFFLSGPLFSVAVLEIDRIKNGNNSWDDRERKLVEYSINNILNDVILEQKRGGFFLKENRFVMILNHSADVVHFFGSLQEKILEFIHVEVSIGIGVPVSNFEEVSRSYETAKSALNTKYFLGFNQVIPFKEQKIKNLSEQDLLEYQNKIMECFIKANFKQLEESLHEILKRIKDFSFGNQSLAVSTCFSFVIVLTQSLQKLAINLTGWESDMHQIKSEMNKMDSYDGLSLVVQDIIYKLYQLISDNNLNKETLIMMRVKKYIEENYSDDITLDTVASIAFMNPYYFSSFFKKHTKQNFKQYLTQIRMNHASRLLLHSDMLVYEIAEKVGYNNSRQFSDMFRRTFGQLPMDYKQQYKNA
ncbi:response regulator [Neobacillus vireti]|uniref:response regulator n=1 Tax=Neobacillus vireti TaxID=220686 RepID=UPI003000D96A